MNAGPGLWTTFLYYFVMTTLIGSVTASQALETSPTSPIAVQIGTVLGGLAGILGTYFNRSLTWELPIQGQKSFWNRLEQILAELNVERLPESEEEEEANVRIYRRSGRGSWFAGRLYVQVEGEQAQFLGRASLIRKLKPLL